MNSAHYDPPDWPYGVQRPQEGEVRACPECGAELIFSCHHDGMDVSARVMPAAGAERLREESGKFNPMMFVCDGCDVEQPLHPGVTIGPTMLCAECSA